MLPSTASVVDDRSLAPPARWSSRAAMSARSDPGSAAALGFGPGQFCQLGEEQRVAARLARTACRRSASLGRRPQTRRRSACSASCAIERIERHSDGRSGGRRPAASRCSTSSRCAVTIRSGRSTSERETGAAGRRSGGSAHCRSSIHSTIGPVLVRRRSPSTISENRVSRACAGETLSRSDG